MNAFTIPPSLIDPTQLPPPIRTSDPHSFARYTFTERIPGILQSVADLDGLSGPARAALCAMRTELLEGTVQELREPTADRAFWNSVSSPYLGRSWFDAPWYWAEAYFYRRLLEAVEYYQPGPWYGVDPFARKKAAELEPGAAPRAVNRLLACLPEDPGNRFAVLLYASLWGNRSDLSYEAAHRLGRYDGARDERAHLLVDDAMFVWDLLRNKQCARLGILADNAGTELLMDLALADFLLCQDLVEEVELHLKPCPTFVSDAMIQDVWLAIEALDRAGGAGAELALRLRRQVAGDVLVLDSHWHYGTSLFFFQLPDDLRARLASMDLVIVKGDANYRRLLGDARWPTTTPFAKAVAYFPARLVSVRTLKAEIIVGLRPGDAERLHAEDPAWLVNGKRGVIQAHV